MTHEINTYGLPMRGLRKAAGETKGLRGYYDAGYVQLSYDRTTGEVLTNNHYSLGHQWWTEYHDPSVTTIRCLYKHHSQQEIADLIAKHLAYEEAVA